MPTHPKHRTRRLRTSPALRDLLAETRLVREDLVAPLFVRSGEGVRREIASMPGQFQLSPDTALETLRRLRDKGLRAALLFGLPDTKDATGSDAWNPDAPLQRLLRDAKDALPDMLLIADTCLCEYTDHGHCGQLADVPGGRDVDNDATLELLARTAVSQAAAGAGVVAPSAMMDGQVRAIRQALDAEGLDRTAILSYAVKFASALYGPFRVAAESAPGFRDRRTYQMDPRAARQADIEADTDAAEGADMLMVKPAGAYLDVIARVRARSPLPLGAYHVSGEYAMLKAAAVNGWVDEQSAVVEVISAVKRAGADFVITYFAESLSEWI